MKRLMIDLETMGTCDNAVICSAGLAIFDAINVIEEYEVKLDWDAQVSSGRVIEASTVRWWLQQRPDVQEDLISDAGVTISVEDMHEVVCEASQGCSQFWAKSPDFDLRLLGHLFEQHGLYLPWKFRQGRDVRTMEDIAKKLDVRYVTETGHGALADAVNQAKMVIAVEQRIYR